MRDCNHNKFCARNLSNSNWSSLPASFSCSITLLFSTNSPLSDFVIDSYSSFTPDSAVLSFSVSSFHCSASCSAPITFSSLLSNLYLSSSISADCSSPRCTSACNFLFSTCNCWISCRALSSCNLSTSVAVISVLSKVFYLFYSPDRPPNVAGLCFIVPRGRSREAALLFSLIIRTTSIR